MKENLELRMKEEFSVFVVKSFEVSMTNRDE